MTFILTGRLAILKRAGGEKALQNKIGGFIKQFPIVWMALGTSAYLLHDRMGSAGYSKKDFDEGLLVDPNGL